MAIRPEVLRALEAAGASLNMILAAIEADRAADDRDQAAALESKRAKDAERQRRHRKSRIVTPVTRDERDPPPKENNQTPTESEGEGARDPAEWPDDYREQAWQAYGQGREKKVSIQALVELERSGKVGWDVFLAGVQRQADHVEPQFRPSLQRFIKREKWLDEYAERPNGGAEQKSFRPVNGSNGHVSPHRGSVAAELRAQIERDLEYVPVDEGEGVRARPLRLVSHH